MWLSEAIYQKWHLEILALEILSFAKKSRLIPLPELKKFLVCTNTTQLAFVVSQ
jgi:hypothetical protein